VSQTMDEGRSSEYRDRTLTDTAGLHGEAAEGPFQLPRASEAERFDPVGLETPFWLEPGNEAPLREPQNMTFGEAPFAELEDVPAREDHFGEDHLGEDRFAEDRPAGRPEREEEDFWAGTATETHPLFEIGETQWLAEVEGGAPDIAGFAERLGREWSGRRGGRPGEEAIRDWLVKDNADTQQGAKLRWGRRYGSGRLTEAAVDRAWMTAREHQMRFQLAPKQPSLGRFAPPRDPVSLVSDPLVASSDVAPVAPLTLRFARTLRSRFGGKVQISNYRGHGGGAFLNRGFSLDLFLEGRDDRGFYPRQSSIALLRAIHASARGVGAEWRAIYNDFDVADAINRETSGNHVIFVGAAARGAGKRVTGINWHGPDPLILHVHLDLAPIGGGQDEAEDREYFDPETPYEAPPAEREDLAWLAYEAEQPQQRCGCCGKDREDRFDAQETATLESPVWQPSQQFAEAVLEAAGFSAGGREEREDEIPQGCADYPESYRKTIRRRGTAQGEVMDRTVGDRVVNLALQFRDYDVNAYLPGTKSAHSAGIAQLTEFIEKRAASGTALAVTITGSASRTGTKAYNDELSRRRAACFENFLKSTLSRFAVAKTSFSVSGEGFTNAQCSGADCELPGFRSVLVSVHAPGRPPDPIPPEPEGWDKYEIRCCSFHSQFLGEALIDDLLGKLPAGLPRSVAEKLLPVLRKRLEVLLKRLLKAPKLTALSGELRALLRFLPIEITRQTAVFQIRERGKDAPRLTTLCYTGFGGRLALPIPGSLDDALDEVLKKVPGLGSNDTVRNAIKKLFKEEVGKLLPSSVSKRLQKLDSDIPGPFKPFDLNRPARMDIFRGDADIFIDAITSISSPGNLFLSFESPAWRRPDKQQRVRLNCQQCADSVIAVQVDGGAGFDLLSVNSGKLVDQGCACVEPAAREQFADQFEKEQAW
jgi:hypothetical protein